MQYKENFDVIVIGGGHAGTEAALASARTDAKTLLLTHNIDTIGQMSCNPAIGGIGKGHLVKEIDALGGAMAEATDKAGIQFRILNSRKGPAVRATRAQTDRALYKQAIRNIVESQENLFLFQQEVSDLVVKNSKVVGVVTQSGISFFAVSVVLTVGTFLGGKIHVGNKTTSGGRAGDPPSIALATRLRALPFRVGRLKTGTPPRLSVASIDFSKLIPQPGDTPQPSFSFWEKFTPPAQVPCHIAYTNNNTHKVIQDNLDKSAMYSGNISGIGPRYCPSIEDKVVRFSDKDKHQIFVEPEGLNSKEIYPNGISTSLPFEVQLDFIRSIVGFEQAHILRPGYAIEYDYFDPRDLYPTLETKIIENLFFAGQINGTTGYEEAGVQGLLAGVNASRKAFGKGAWYPKRSDGYIGVLVDDLITLGTQEPYRMFTSRAEYRLTLREDNADFRLSPIARELGLLSDVKWQKFVAKRKEVANKMEELAEVMVHPGTNEAKALEVFLPGRLEREYRATELLKRPELDFKKIVDANLVGNAFEPKVAEQVEIQIKYAGYIQRQQQEIASLVKTESKAIPLGFNYNAISGLSNEVKEKLYSHRPTTIGQAGRIPGVTPAAISLLLVSLKKLEKVNKT